MVVRAYNSFSRTEQREIDNDLYTALTARRQAAQHCTVLPFPAPPARAVRRAGARYALCWAAYVSLLCATLYGMAATDSTAAATAGFGLLVLIGLAGLPWLMQEHDKWEADK